MRSKKVTAERVDALFHEAARYPPWPRIEHCQNIADYLNALSRIGDGRKDPTRQDPLERSLRSARREIVRRSQKLSQTYAKLKSSVPPCDKPTHGIEYLVSQPLYAPDSIGIFQRGLARGL